VKNQLSLAEQGKAGQPGPYQRAATDIMRTQWKLAALILLAVVALGVLFLAIATPIIPRDTVQVSVEIRSGDMVDQVDPWIIKAILAAFALLVLGVLAWVARHIHRRDRRPEA
jgi:hypothetical protein